MLPFFGNVPAEILCELMEAKLFGSLECVFLQARPNHLSLSHRSLLLPLPLSPRGPLNMPPQPPLAASAGEREVANLQLGALFRWGRPRVALEYLLQG